MHIEFDLNVNDAEALLRHCQTHVPASGDPREDAHLMDALTTLVEALMTADAQS